MEQKTGNQKKHKIDSIVPGSIADQLAVEPGDLLISVNGVELEDVFDYQYQTNEEFLTVLIEKPDGEEWELEIEKEYEEDLGIVFANGLMDNYRSCSNKCIFCFIDQMPPGMRKTLYFKDDDSRLSFLQGNYVTLTNMKEKDIDRIIKYKLAPINISVQTMNPELRCMMLNNRFAGEALKKMQRLFEAGIMMNGQIVLCKGVNDKEELEYTIQELTAYLPHMASVSIVPAGLTKHRDGLYPLEPFTQEEAAEVLQIVHHWQAVCMERWQTHFIHASDEWYLLAQQELPPAAQYDGYLQLENGVGMLRLLMDEFRDALQKEKDIYMQTKKAAQAGVAHGIAQQGKTCQKTQLSVATGMLAAPFIQMLAEEFMELHPETYLTIYPIRNDFFGEQITVSGLLTGQDLQAQLTGKALGTKLLLPCNLLRSGEEVFLDDMTVTELKNTLQVEIVIVNSNGQDLYDAFHG